MTVATSSSPRSKREVISFASEGDPGLFGLRRNSKDRALDTCSSKIRNEDGGNDQEVPVSAETKYKEATKDTSATKSSTAAVNEPISPTRELRHSSDSCLYSASQQKRSPSCLLSSGRWSGGRLLSNKNDKDYPSAGAQNEEFTTVQHQPYAPPAGASLCIAQRSGKGGVRAVIAIIESKSPSSVIEDENESQHKIDVARQTAETKIDPPTAECYALSQWASDPYYRVVISSSGGMPAIIRAMKAHPQSADLQVVGCEAITKLSFNSVANQLQILSAGGMEVLFTAMRNHPTNEILQGVACDALLCLTSILMQQSFTLMMEQLTKVDDAAELLEQARGQFRESSFLSEKSWDNVGLLLQSFALCKSTSSLPPPLS